MQHPSPKPMIVLLCENGFGRKMSKQLLQSLTAAKFTTDYISPSSPSISSDVKHKHTNTKHTITQPNICKTMSDATSSPLFAFSSVARVDKNAVDAPSDLVMEQMAAGAFRSLCEHLRARSDEVQNIDLMTIGGFCRNCLAKVSDSACANPFSR